jgi:hypothetical protein
MSEPDTMASSVISAHAFDAVRWWDRCAGCGYSMAAHSTMTERMRVARASSLGGLDHRCPDCVQLDYDQVEYGVVYRVQRDCPHRWEN